MPGTSWDSAVGKQLTTKWVSYVQKCSALCSYLCFGDIKPAFTVSACSWLLAWGPLPQGIWNPAFWGYRFLLNIFIPSQNGMQAKSIDCQLSFVYILAPVYLGKFGSFEIECTALCPVTVLSEQSLAVSYDKQQDFCFILPGTQCWIHSSISLQCVILISLDIFKKIYSANALRVSVSEWKGNTQTPSRLSLHSKE